MIGRRTLIVGAVASAALPCTTRAASRWRPLWDGKTFSGWQTFLRVGAAKDAPPIGVDSDPNGVFSVVKADGAPAIRISGQDWGALTTREDFADYHFRVEFRWGEKRWPPRETAKRDSGVLYHCVGAHGAGSGAWMKSFETQVQEGDCGDFHSVAGVIIDIEAVPLDPPQPYTLIYKKGAPLVRGVRHRIIRDRNHERPTGRWNVMEVFAVGATSVHLVNGKPVMVLRNLRHKVGADEVPLVRGQLQIQSEGAEVFYRRPQIRPMPTLPYAFKCGGTAAPCVVGRCIRERTG